MNCLYVFNPENDMALADGHPGYTPPVQIQQMRRELWWLPQWWADEEDIVWNGEDRSGGLMRRTSYGTARSGSICRTTRVSCLGDGVRHFVINSNRQAFRSRFYLPGRSWSKSDNFPTDKLPYLSCRSFEANCLSTDTSQAILSFVGASRRQRKRQTHMARLC